jgi:hypothetical protein
VDLNDTRPLNLKPGHRSSAHMEILVNTIQYTQLPKQLRAALRKEMV